MPGSVTVASHHSAPARRPPGGLLSWEGAGNLCQPWALGQCPEFGAPLHQTAELPPQEGGSVSVEADVPPPPEPGT